MKCNQNDKSLKETKRDVSIAFSNNKKMKTKYKHISKWERKRIKELTQAGKANKYLTGKKPQNLSVVFYFSDL